MPKVTVSSKGWVVIPANLRKRYNIKPGSELEIEDQGNFMLIKPNFQTNADSLFGILKKKDLKNR